MELSESMVVKSRANLLLGDPFFGTPAMNLTMKRDDRVGTMAVDGTYLYYCSKFVEALLGSELETVLAHEVLHCVLRHMYRRGDRDLDEWNICCDYAVNIILVDAGRTLPKGALVDQKFRGWTAERIYAYRQNERDKAQPQSGGQPQAGGPPQTGGNGGKGSGAAPNAPGSGVPGWQAKPQPGSPAPSTPSGPGTPTGGKPDGKKGAGKGKNAPAGPPTGWQEPPKDPDPGKDVGEAMKACPTGYFVDAPPTVEGADAGKGGALTEADWAILSEQAERVAAKAGRMPLGAERSIDAAKENRTDWKQELKEFYQSLVPTDMTWSRPNRRFAADGLILPGVYRESMGEIVAVVDTSGSIGRSILNTFGTGLNGLMEDVRPERLTILYCDARVAGSEEFEPDDDVELHPKGGGGTRFQPAFDYVEAEGLRPVALIYLTDLMSSDTPENPPYPVLWVTPEWITKEGPFGRTIRVTVE